MSIRQKLNQNSIVTIGGAGLIIVLALVMVVMQFRGNHPQKPTGLYFTVDDGKNYFAESLGTVPPITKGGKEAVQAIVFKCGWGKPFVGFLQRYTPEAKARMEEAAAANREPPLMPAGTEAKRPGESEWVKATDERYMAITNIRCPDGSLDGLKTVWP